MEGVAGSTTAADAEDPEDPPHPVMNASVIAPSTTLISTSQYDRKKVLKCEKDWILEPLVATATSRLAHIGTPLVKTMRVLVPVQENARNFIGTPFLKLRHVKFTLTLIEPQQRKSLAHSFIHILRCRSDGNLIYNRSGFFMGRHEDPHHTPWMKSGWHSALLFC
jgi:hypothetical protein